MLARGASTCRTVIPSVMTRSTSASARVSSTVAIRPMPERTSPTTTVRTSGTSGARTAPRRTRCRPLMLSSSSGRTHPATMRTCSPRTTSSAWACTSRSTVTSRASTARRSSTQSPAVHPMCPDSTRPAIPLPRMASTEPLSTLTTPTMFPASRAVVTRSAPTPGRTRWVLFLASPCLSTSRACLQRPGRQRQLPPRLHPLTRRPPLIASRP